MPKRQYPQRINIDFIALVEEIKHHPVIWDAKNTNHHNRLLLAENWKAVGKAMNQDSKIFIYNFFSFCKQIHMHNGCTVFIDLIFIFNVCGFLDVD